MNWCRSIRNILVKYNLRSVWKDEKKLWNIDNSGNGEAKSLKDHKRFLRKFFRRNPSLELMLLLRKSSAWRSIF